MNKKGAVPLLAMLGLPLWILITFVALAVLFLLAFTFSLKIKLLVIGLILLLYGLFKLLPKVIDKGFTKANSIALILILLVGSFMVFGGNYFSVSAGNFLSVSNVEYDGSNRIIVYGTTGGAEDFTISKDKINSYIEDDGYRANNDVSGSVRLLEQKKKFPIQNTNNVFFEIQEKNIGTWSVCSVNKCNEQKPNSQYSVIESYRSINTRCICTYKNPVASEGIFTGVEYIYSNTQFTIGGESKSLILNDVSKNSYSNTRSISFGNNIIEWVGELGNVANINPPSSYSVLFRDNTYRYLIDRTAHSKSLTEYDRYIKCINDGKSSGLDLSETEIINCANAHNNNVINLLGISYHNQYKSQSIIKNVLFEGNNFIVTPNYPTSFPSFKMILDASKFSIIPLKGEPNIISCFPSKDIFSGDSYETKISVRNVGQNDGSFSGSINCNNGVSGYIGEKFFEAGETQDMQLSLTGINTNVGSKLKSDCTIKVTDLKSQKYDTCTSYINLVARENIVCEANSIKCIDSQTLRTCNDKGTAFTDKKCDKTCIYVDAKAQCSGVVPPPISPNQTLTCSWYQTKTLKSEAIYKWYNYVGIGEPIVTTNEVCATSGLLILIVISSVVLILGIFTIYKFAPKNSALKRAIRRKRW